MFEMFHWPRRGPLCLNCIKRLRKMKGWVMIYSDGTDTQVFSDGQNEARTLVMRAAEMIEQDIRAVKVVEQAEGILKGAKP